MSRLKLRNHHTGVLLWSLIAVMLLAACSGQSSADQETIIGSETPAPSATLRPFASSTPVPSPTPTQPSGTVRIWHSLSEAQVPALEQIIGDFQETYPDIQFDVLYIPLENLPKQFEASILDHTAPDLVLGPAEWGLQFYPAGWVVNPSGVIDAERMAEINPAALEASLLRGDLVGLPYSQQGVALFRNAALVSEAPATFDDLVKASTAITQGEQIGAILERGFLYAGAHLNGLGGKLMDAQGMPAFNTNSGLAWMDLLGAFEQAGPTVDFNDQDLDAFKQGRVGFIIDGTWNMQALADALGAENLAVDPWPAYKDGALSGYVQPGVAFLSSQSSGPDQAAALMFMEALVSPEAQSHLANYGILPVVSEIEQANTAQGKLISQALAALTGGTGYPLDPAMALYPAQMDLAIKSVFTMNTLPAEALRVASEALIDAVTHASVTPTP